MMLIVAKKWQISGISYGLLIFIMTASCRFNGDSFRKTFSSLMKF